MKLMSIGISINPREFPRGFKQSLPILKKLGCHVSYSTLGFMIIVPAVRKFSAKWALEPTALRVLDNCFAQYDGCDDLKSDDGLIQVINLSPNVTAECQPMDRLVINAIKTRYKRKLMFKLVLENEDLSLEQRLKNVSLRPSTDWISEVWDEISPVTIENSWKKLFDEFPSYAWNMPDQAEDLSEDLKSLVKSIDGIAGANTTDEQVRLWVEDRVLDSEEQTISITSEIMRCDEIVSSAWNKSDNSICLEKEWLGSTADTLDSSVTK